MRSQSKPGQPARLLAPFVLTQRVMPVTSTQASGLHTRKPRFAAPSAGFMRKLLRALLFAALCPCPGCLGGILAAAWHRRRGSRYPHLTHRILTAQEVRKLLS